MNTEHVECDASNSRGNWNHLKMFQKVPELRTGKSRNQGTTENRHTLESTNVKVQYNTFNITNSVICSKNSNNRIAATLYSLRTWFFSRI